MRKKNIILALNLFLSLLIVSLVSAAEVFIAWIPPQPLGAVKGYKIFRRVEGKSYDYLNPACDVGVGINDCLVPDLKVDVLYFFVARSYNAYYETGDSNEVPCKLSSAIPTTTTIPTLNRPAGLIIVQR